jgi:hypothetical protein
MQERQTVRRVPWTCRWSRFGEPVEAGPDDERGFVFWTCGHPDAASARLDRKSCERCPKWEPSEAFRDEVSVSAAPAA